MDGVACISLLLLLVLVTLIVAKLSDVLLYYQLLYVIIFNYNFYEACIANSFETSKPIQLILCIIVVEDVYFDQTQPSRGEYKVLFTTA